LWRGGGEEEVDNMAATTWKVCGYDQEIGINSECSNMKCKQNIVHSERVKFNNLVSAENLLEFRMDFDEPQKLYNIST
jgi:hypothetical protein